VVYLMKHTEGEWMTYDSQLYDFFVYIHSYGINSWVWHGTSFFLNAHKWFLWCFESAMIYTAYINRDELGITAEKACCMTLPYWDWTLDYDPNEGDKICPVTNSQIFDSTCLGGNQVDKNDKTVKDGVFGTNDTFDGGWSLLTPICSDDKDPKNKEKANYNNKLKRRIECDGAYNLNIGPSTVMNAIMNYTRFCDWTRWLEALPHGLPHMFFGYSMATMSSPDDPVFWLHHCNIDRLWHLWMDCNGYDNVTADKLTTLQYEAKNPVIDGNPVLANPVTHVPYVVGIDDFIVFTRNQGGDDTPIFPKAKWPTPRKLWSLGTDKQRGHDGIYYRYGTDPLVRAFGKSCKDTNWTLVDVGYVPKTKSKRDAELIHPVMREKVDTYEAKLAAGKSHMEVLKEMAVSECEQAPKNEIDDLFLDWIKMMGHKPENYDSICDKPSQRLRDRKNENGENRLTDLDYQNNMGTNVPLWLILVASLSAGLVLIAVITVVMIFVRRKSEVKADDDYRQME